MLNIQIGKYCRNKKSGNLYFMYKIATDVSNNETHQVVIYSNISTPEILYVRKLDEFKEKFEESNI